MHMDEESKLLTMITSSGGIIGWIRSRGIVSDLCNYKYPDGGLVDICTAGTYFDGDLVIDSRGATATHSELIDMVYVPEILSGLVVGLFIGCLVVGFRRLQMNRQLTHDE